MASWSELRGQHDTLRSKATESNTIEPWLPDENVIPAAWLQSLDTPLDTDNLGETLISELDEERRSYEPQVSRSLAPTIR